MTQTLSLQNLCVTASQLHQRQTLLRNVSLTLTKGKILALIGASGSGKTMTGRAMLGLLPPNITASFDSLTFKGAEIAPADLRGKIVASILQNPSSAFNPLYTMRQHAAETLKALGKADQRTEEKIQQALLASGLENPEQILPRYAFELSGGQLQRMMIALACLSEAPFLIADEPTSDLDLIVQRQILDQLQQLAQKHALGVLLITHDLSVAAKLADEIAVMDKGEIIEQGSVSEIFTSPAHPVTQRFVKAHLSLYEEDDLKEAAFLWP